MQVEILVDPIQVIANANAWDAAGAWDPAGVRTVYNIPRDLLVALAEALVQRQRQARAPQLCLPGVGLATMPDGSILSLGAGGEVYRDAEQLVGVAARQVVQFGTRIYAQGLTQPLWWRWTGTAWTQVTKFDPGVLKDLP